MFQFLKNHLQGAWFALLKLQVLICFHYLGGVAAYLWKLQKQSFNPEYIQSILCCLSS